MEKLYDASDRPRLSLPRGIDPLRFLRAKRRKAVMTASISEHGTVTVNCPYCIVYYREQVPVDVTRFVETDRESTTECQKRGHTLKFRPTGQWREERQQMGLQVKP